MNQEALEKEFTAAFDEYGDAIFRFCVLKVSNTELAEDMTQETFTRLWTYLRDGKDIQNTRALLYTIAGNLAKDWYKKKKSESLDARMDIGHEPGEAGTQMQNALLHEVLDAIHDMDDIDKEVLLLRYVEGLEPKDIAEMLEETANVVSVRLNRAMKRLQKQLSYE